MGTSPLKPSTVGKFRDLGDPAAALAEECSEVIKVIAKKLRFNGSWQDIPPGQNTTRWEELSAEMDDLIYQWNRLKEGGRE
jgi:hypothetical protein